MNKDIKVKDLKTNIEPFDPTPEYLDSMPDLQNGEFDDIPIDFVGIHGFHLPLQIRQKDGNTQEALVTITGTVSLTAHERGINMSRIIRTMYGHKDDVFDINKIEEVLRDYQRDLKTFDAHMLFNYKYRIWQDALVTTKENGEKEGGWQYYNVTFDCNLDVDGKFTKIMWVDFLYSSACPCSTALTEHMMYERGLAGIPHSQRSVARVGLTFDKMIWIEDLIDTLRETLVTEVLVFCKRADEQDFSRRNAYQTKFVEDAVRMIAHALDENPGVLDYKVICSHNESLHAHNAIGVITKHIPGSIFNHHVSMAEWMDLARA